jgi:tetratricopeptide (TPR) repeat protein
MSGAVFLSYASQDAEAARRICEALRAAGVEVWFDESELRGGDSWDAKIRKQIRECVLFIPVISKHTQERREGYFRLEWKLADDRTHLMAQGTPFLLPVCIDDTKDWDAIVPDSFTIVQWSRLPQGVTTPAFCDRTKTLLAGPAPEAPSHGATRTGSNIRVASPLARRPLWLWAMLAGLVVVAAVGLWRSWHHAEGGNLPGAKPATQAEELLARARAQVSSPNTSADNAAVGEDLCRQAVELAPDSAQAWAERAYIQSYYIVRTWDSSEKRLLDTQTYANRALALDPNESEAMLALSAVLSMQGANPASEALLRKALKLNPDDSRIWRRLGSVLQSEKRFDEAVAIDVETIRRFPKDPLAQYDLAMMYMTQDQHPSPRESLKHLNAALALDYFPSAILNKALVEAGGLGDFAAAQQTWDSLAPVDRTSDRAVSIAMWLGLLQRHPQATITAGALTAHPYFDDFYFRGPKSEMLAIAYHIAGKEALAQSEWNEAERVVQERLKDSPASTILRIHLGIARAWRGDTQGARAALEGVEATVKEGPVAFSYYLLAEYYAGLGDSARAVAYLRTVLNLREMHTDATLAYDPWWDKLHGTPEFEALRAEATQRIAQNKR